MPSESYSDIIKGDLPLTDKPVVVHTRAGSAPVQRMLPARSVFDQHLKRTPSTQRPIDEMETVRMEPPPPRGLRPPSRAEELYMALIDLGKDGCGKKLTKREAETLRRWVNMNKKPGLTIRKSGDGPTPFIAWVHLPEEPK